MMAADYRHIGGVENRLGRHYSRFSPFSPTPALADQSLALRKSWNAGSNRRSQANDAIERRWPAQRHAKEEAQRARHLVDMRPRPAGPCQVKLRGANLLDAQPIRRATEETAELGNRVNVGLLGCWREVANRHVVDHPSTQRGHLSHHRISCLMIGSGQPQSSQTGAPSRQAGYPPASGFVQCWATASRIRGRLPPESADCAPLAGKSTLNRLE